MSIKSEIAERKYAISMYGYDAWGSSASSNVDRMKILETEIANLKRYGVPNPSFLKRLFTPKKLRRLTNMPHINHKKED